MIGAVNGGELAAIVIAGWRGDWPGGPRILMPREPTREPNGTLWFGAELPAGDQVWFRIAEEAIGRMPEKTPRDRGARLVVEELRTLQAEYEAWRDGLPESLGESRTADLLDGVCGVDLEALDVELPRGFGRD